VLGVVLFSGVNLLTYAATNLIANPSLETVSPTNAQLPDGWFKGFYGKSTLKWTYPVTGVDGAKAARIDITTYTNGDAKWMPPRATIVPGREYIFSDRYQSDVATRVVYEFRTSAGAVTYIQGPAVTVSSSTWKTVQHRFVAPANMTSVVVFHLINKKGWLVVDNYSLTDATTTPLIDTIPPSVVITKPLSGSAASSTIPLIASSSDNVGVAGVSFLIDNVLLGETVVAPYTMPFDTKTVLDGAHTVIAVARDTTGNKATSTPVTFSVNNTPPPVIPPVIGTGTITVNVSVINNNGGTKQIADFPVFLNGTLIDSGVSTTTTVGSYTITKTSDAGYTSSFSSGCGTSGTFFLATSSSVMCALTYDDVDTTPPAPTSTNLLLNPSFELMSTTTPANPLNWTRGGWGNNKGIYTYPIVGADGGKATRVELTSYKTGDIKWVSDSISGVAGKRLRFNDMYRSNVPTYIDVEYTHADGSKTYGDVGLLLEPSATWKSYQLDFEIPYDVTSIKITPLLDRVGWLEVDATSLVERPRVPFDQGMITLAYDDGYESIYQEAIPILNAHGIRSTQFVITGSLNSTDGLYMKTADLLAMQASGHEIAAHTRTHPHLTQITSAQATDEIAGSRTDLLNLGITSVDTFTYPYGEYDDTVKQIVRNAGYIGARSVDMGFTNKDTDKYVLLDQHIESNTTIASVRQWIDQAIATKTWLILEFHQQKTNCGADLYCNTPSLMTDIANYIVQSGIPAVTLREGIAKMNP
jgi:peptidoglycan/xylan/chitin deacetylase (PgdA/CDA1 family)